MIIDKNESKRKIAWGKRVILKNENIAITFANI